MLKWDCDHCEGRTPFADGRCINCRSPFSTDEIENISDDDIDQVYDPEQQDKILNYI